MQLFCFIAHQNNQSIAIEIAFNPRLKQWKSSVPEAKHQGTFVPVQAQVQLFETALCFKQKCQ